MKRLAFAAGATLFAVAWWFVWRYVMCDWLENRSFTYQAFMAVYLILWCCIPVGACVRVVSAAFSQRSRDSILRHKLVHAMWFLLAGVLAFCWLAPIIFAGKTKG